MADQEGKGTRLGVSALVLSWWIGVVEVDWVVLGVDWGVLGVD